MIVQNSEQSVQNGEQAVQGKPLELSVIICTRDRPDTLLPAVQSVLADLPNDGCAELLVVDQGTGDAGAQTLAEVLARDSRLRYMPETSVGLSKARNAGIRATSGALIAFTDDDCAVEPGWLAAIKEVFATRPDVGLVFGFVACAEHDASEGFVPGFEASEGVLGRRQMFPDAGHWGMGANMALRRSTFERVGPFDELLGAGAPLKSAEDVDYVLRTQRQGLSVYHCARARVVHAGFRPWAAASALVIGSWLGIGAAYAKQVRGGSLFVWSLVASDLGGRVWNVLRNGVLRRRPLGANALLAELRGLWRGLRLPLERRQASPYLLFRGERVDD